MMVAWFLGSMGISSVCAMYFGPWGMLVFPFGVLLGAILGGGDEH